MSTEFAKDFAANNQLFRISCELGKVEPTKRQAAKWKQGRGTALKFKAQAQELITQTQPKE